MDIFLEIVKMALLLQKYYYPSDNTFHPQNLSFRPLKIIRGFFIILLKYNKTHFIGGTYGKSQT